MKFSQKFNNMPWLLRQWIPDISR